MKLDPYLNRIGLQQATRPSLANLFALQKAHTCRIPFENLDVQLGLPLTTDVAAAYDKIVNRARGGWCYEQNGLFGWVLEEIGFEVTRIAASVMREERGDIADANHLCLLVRCEDSARDWLADVGFGGSLLQPIPLRAADIEQRPFRLGLRRLDDGHWRFWEDDGSGEFSFDFRVETADEDALSRRCEFLQTDPDSGFVKSLVAQRRRRNRHLTLRGRVLDTVSPGGTQRQLLNSAAELVATLRRHFDLEVPAVADLWPRIVTRHDEYMEEQE